MVYHALKTSLTSSWSFDEGSFLSRSQICSAQAHRQLRVALVGMTPGTMGSPSLPSAPS